VYVSRCASSSTRSVCTVPAHRERNANRIDAASTGGAHYQSYRCRRCKPAFIGYIGKGGADGVPSLTEEGTARALVTDQERLLAQVEHALHRMDEGTYGLSKISGRPIPLERLEALPWATTTVDDPVQP
jgi:hypothetical protein